MSEMLAIDSEDIRPLPAEVGRYLGGPEYKISPKIHGKIIKAVEEAARIAGPVVGYGIYPVEVLKEKGRLRISLNDMLDVPPKVAEHDSRYIAAVIGTLGQALGLACRRLTKEGKFFQAMLLDAVGTAMLDRLGKISRDILEKQANMLGLVISSRFAPGLNDMPLETQARLCVMANAEQIGVRLNEAFIMEPEKSISFFMTFGSHENWDACFHKCQDCQMKACQFRMAV